MKLFLTNSQILLALCISFLVVTSGHADTTTTTTTTTTTNADGSTTTTVKETIDTEEETTETVTAVPVIGGRNIVGPAGVTGTIRRSDRRQDRRNGDARLDHNDGVDIDRDVNHR